MVHSASRPERLQTLVARLRDGQRHRAEDLARDLRVSVRTVYRDMDLLAASGVPVEGTRGHGYRAHDAVTLPPLNLTENELGALQLALTALAAADLPEQAEAARSLAAKIDAVLPEEGQPGFAFATDALAAAAFGLGQLPAIRAAIRARQKLRITLTRALSPQDIRPLQLDYWGRVWTCLAWSDTAGDFTRLPLAQVTGLTPLPGLFVDEPGKRLGDWHARQQQGLALDRAQRDA